MKSSNGRLRLIVIQALVFSLFATLFARLYFLQVVDGDAYHAQAASQSVREIVVQPQRGLIVDDMGRPLVANRTSWVVSVDRGTLAKLPEDEQGALLHRVARVTDFLDAVRRVADCGTVLDPEVVAQLMVRHRSDSMDLLTPRESEVLRLMAEGRSNAGIARQLWLAGGTVEKHVKSILAKLDIHATEDDHRRVLAVIAFLESR